ncbi:uncharacterized protein EHS24_005606 [Apiotrichum porosum]|uniref:Uncharacterized protein n=1 Tax=Apiotrichum porosum TaxID=105984 RepID=A0A427XYZ7_9TREE|nr:uncharacterized protein EHS24_005606 [Apiotrichum porosum]RSH84108.1 hypothetical protein EHS24_005606 [Apiotrichum porosum]
MAADPSAVDSDVVMGEPDTTTIHPLQALPVDRADTVNEQLGERRRKMKRKCKSAFEDDPLVGPLPPSVWKLVFAAYYQDIKTEWLDTRIITGALVPLLLTRSLLPCAVEALYHSPCVPYERVTAFCRAISTLEDKRTLSRNTLPPDPYELTALGRTRAPLVRDLTLEASEYHSAIHIPTHQDGPIWGLAAKCAPPPPSVHEDVRQVLAQLDLDQLTLSVLIDGGASALRFLSALSTVRTKVMRLHLAFEQGDEQLRPAVASTPFLVQAAVFEDRVASAREKRLAFTDWLKSYLAARTGKVDFSSHPPLLPARTEAESQAKPKRLGLLSGTPTPPDPFAHRSNEQSAYSSILSFWLAELNRAAHAAYDISSKLQQQLRSEPNPLPPSEEQYLWRCHQPLVQDLVHLPRPIPTHYGLTTSVAVRKDIAVTWGRPGDRESETRPQVLDKISRLNRLAARQIQGFVDWPPIHFGSPEPSTPPPPQAASTTSDDGTDASFEPAPAHRDIRITLAEASDGEQLIAALPPIVAQGFTSAAHMDDSKRVTPVYWIENLVPILPRSYDAPQPILGLDDTTTLVAIFGRRFAETLQGWPFESLSIVAADQAAAMALRGIWRFVEVPCIRVRVPHDMHPLDVLSPKVDPGTEEMLVPLLNARTRVFELDVFDYDGDERWFDHDIPGEVSRVVAGDWRLGVPGKDIHSTTSPLAANQKSPAPSTLYTDLYEDDDGALSDSAFSFNSDDSYVDVDDDEMAASGGEGEGYDAEAAREQARRVEERKRKRAEEELVQEIVEETGVILL